MDTKDLIIALLWGVGAVLFALVGFAIVSDWKEYEPIAIGLFLWLGGLILDRLWRPAAAA